MNDTINLQLHNLEKHQTIVNQLRIYSNGYRKFDGKGSTLMHEIILPDISKREKEKFIYRTVEVASSHYKIIITVDKYKDVINFNFSIPKYFYGHNIAQAVQNTCDIDFNFTLYSFEDILMQGFERLKSYIKTFFNNEFPAHKIDYNELEYKRLDFCYNQVFKSKQDALGYLELQKEIKKKYLRESSQVSNNYKTSIFYANQDYSVKIYHKGTEYEKNDKAEHNRINTIKKRKVFDTEYLQEFSDRILRYEITIRPSYMSYLYNSKIFRKNSKQFKTWRMIYNKIKTINKKHDEQILQEKVFDLIDKKKELIALFPMLKNKIDRETKLDFLNLMHLLFYKKTKQNISTDLGIQLLNRFYGFYDTLIHTRRKFMFSLNSDDRNMFLYDNETNANRFECFPLVPMTNNLFCLMANKMKEFIFDMRIEDKKPITFYLNAIDAYNSTQKKNREISKGYIETNDYKGFDKAKLGLIVVALERYNIDSLTNILGLSKSTVYKYKADLLKIGYTKNTLNKVNIDVPDIDFKTYYIETTFNQYKFFQNNMFKLD